MVDLVPGGTVFLEVETKAFPRGLVIKRTVLINVWEEHNLISVDPTQITITVAFVNTECANFATTGAVVRV
jgi:hypothetical protein